MSQNTAWPIRKGIFRSQNIENIPQRSPSPIVEMPLSPDPETISNGNPLSPPLSMRYPSIERSLSPRRSQSPFSSAMNKGIREIPIQVEHEVRTKEIVTHFFFEL